MTIKLINDHLHITSGKDSKIETGVNIRRVRDTKPSTGIVLPFAKPLSIMLDKRAPGLYVEHISGPKARMEYLAELTVHKDLIAQVAEVLMDFELLRKVHDKLVRNNQRIKTNVLTIDYPTLLRAVSAAINAKASQGDPRRIVAWVLTELLAKPYTKQAVMVPFVGAIELERFSDPIATTTSLKTAAMVSVVADVFDAIQVGDAFGKTREFNAAAAEAILSPILLTAGNRLMNVLRYQRYMEDAAIMVGRYLVDLSALPDHVRDNADLPYLASNFSFAYGALTMAGNPITTPDFNLDEALSWTAMKLREMRRFETIPLEKFRDMYAINVARLPTGRLAGVHVYRNVAFKLGAQVTQFYDREEYVMQVRSEVGEAYLAPLADAVNAGFGGSRLMATSALAMDHYITAKVEADNDNTAAFGTSFNMSEMERIALAVAWSRNIFIADISGRQAPGDIGPAIDLPMGLPRLMFEVGDNKAHYVGKALYTGSTAMTDDPYELLILLGEDKEPKVDFPLRPQSIMDDARRMVLLSRHAGMFSSLSRNMTIELPRMGDKKIETTVSIQQLLGLEDIGDLEVTVEEAPQQIVRDTFTAMLFAAEALRTKSTEVHKMLAHQIIVAMHELMMNVGRATAMRRINQTVFVRLLQTPDITGAKSLLRSHLLGDVAQHRLITSMTFLILARLGILEFELKQDIVNAFNEENVVEIAATAESWQEADRKSVV